MKGEELSLPGLPYNPRQLFWLSGASIWCSSMRDEALKSIVLTDPHSPSRYQCIQGWGGFPSKQNWKHKSAIFLIKTKFCEKTEKKNLILVSVNKRIKISTNVIELGSSWLYLAVSQLHQIKAPDPKPGGMYGNP